MERTEVYIHVSYEPYPFSIIKNNRDKIWKRLMEVAVAEGLLPPEVLGEDGEGIYVYIDYRDPTSALVKPFLERPLPPDLADLVRRRARIFSPVGELVRGEKVNEGEWNPDYLEGSRSLAEKWRAFLSGDLSDPPAGYDMDLQEEDLDILLPHAVRHPYFKFVIDRVKEELERRKRERQRQAELEAFMDRHQIRLYWGKPRRYPFDEGYNLVALVEGEVAGEPMKAELENIFDVGPLFRLGGRGVAQRGPREWVYLDDESAVPENAALFLEAAWQTAPPQLLWTRM